MVAAYGFQESNRVTHVRYPCIASLSTTTLAFLSPFLDTIDSLSHPPPVTNLPYCTILAFLSPFLDTIDSLLHPLSVYRPILLYNSSSPLTHHTYQSFALFE